jgi:hypothetical protein
MGSTGRPRWAGELMEGIPGPTCPFPWTPLGRRPSMNALLYTRYDVLAFVPVLEGHAPDQGEHQMRTQAKTAFEPGLETRHIRHLVDWRSMKLNSIHLLHGSLRHVIWTGVCRLCVQVVCFL